MIQPVRISNFERVSVFTIGKSQLQYGNVVSDQLMMCDVAQFCTIATASSSSKGIYVNSLGSLVFERFGTSSSLSSSGDSPPPTTTPTPPAAAMEGGVEVDF